LLMLFGGIVILSQREVRFGGSLCLYAVIAEWLFHIYQMANDSFQVETWHIYYGIAAACVFIWAYGYKSDDKPTGLARILHLAAYAVAAVVLVQAIAFLAAAVPAIFG